MEEKKLKVLILYNNLFHYRIPIFNILAQKYDLTVSYSYKQKESAIALCDFKTHFLPIEKKWKFFFHSDNLLEYCSGFDVVVAYGQVTWLSVAQLARNSKRRFKIGYWSIGVPAGYNRKYDDGNKLMDVFTDFFLKKSDALIFYTDYPVKKYIARGYESEKLFIANNTVKVNKFESVSEKDSILFIGTLYMGKGLLSLLENYRDAYQQSKLLPNLNIVGGGEQYETVRDWVKENKLEAKIILFGPIFDIQEKAEIFSKAIATISPDQAGLSVLESMGYGVPFITYVDAISGGESFNIKDGVNGRRFDRKIPLSEVILDISNNREKYKKMGELAFEHYWSCRKPEDMAKGISDAIEYMKNSKR